MAIRQYRSGDFIISVTRAAIPAVPAVPGRRLLVASADWDSGAVSIPIVETNGGYKWRVKPNTVGAVVGLASNYSGSGYRSIDHGLIFRRGRVHVFNRGVEGPDLGTHVADDVFSIGRAGGSILVLKNGTRVHAETSQIRGVFRLAATIYLTENTVDDAAVVPLSAFLSGTGDGVVPPIEGLAVAEADGVASGVLPALVGLSASLNRGVGDGVLPRLVGLASTGFYGMGDGVLPMLDGQADGGGLVLDINFADGVLPYVGGYARGKSGQVAAGNGSLPRLEGIASDRFIGISSSTLPALHSYSGIAVTLSGGIIGYGRYSVAASSQAGERQGVFANLPGFSLRARGGVTLKAGLPKLALVAGGTFDVVARAVLQAPQHDLVASGTVSSLAKARFKFSRYGVVARNGAVARFAAGTFSLSSHGTAGSVGVARLRYSAVRLVFAGKTENVARAVMVLPRLTMTRSAVAALVGPRYYVHAVGAPGIESSYEAYSINIATGAVTRYTEFAFDNVLRFGDRFFGIRADGVYELAGDTDDGDPIIANVRTFNTDFGRANLKRVPFLYVIGDTNTDLTVGFTADCGVEYRYPVGLVSTQGVQASRAKSGLGVKGTYYNFSLSNEEGQRFQIDRLEAIVDTTTVVKG